MFWFYLACADGGFKDPWRKVSIINDKPDDPNRPRGSAADRNRGATIFLRQRLVDGEHRSRAIVRRNESVGRVAKYVDDRGKRFLDLCFL